MTTVFKPTNCLSTLLNLFYPEKPDYEELTFTTKAWLKMITYAHLAGNLEISGYGRIENGTVTDVRLTKQEVESARVNATAESQIEFIRSLPKEELGQWTLDWHSHVDMSAFSSNIDDNNYKERWENNGNRQFPILIINKRQEYHAECYISPYRRTPIKIKIKKENFSKDNYLSMYDECVKDVEENVTQKTYTYTSYKWGDSWEDTTKKKEAPSKKKKKEIIINGEECESCGCGLDTAAELIRGICDDCWEQMSWQEKVSYCEDINISLSEAEGYI